MNEVTLVGNLGNVPELKATPGGSNLCTFSMATSRRWKDRDGQQQDETEWHRVVLWGRQAEIAHQHLGKGSKILLRGRLQTRSWDDQATGEKRYMTEVVGQFFKFLDSKRTAHQGPVDIDSLGTRVDDDSDLPF